jgi:SEC-C motif-containing protein
MKCPCCSGLTYEQCCKPYHDGKSAPTPLALMRSRYSAYARSLPAYIQKTTHPTGPHFNPNREEWTRDILSFCQSTRFLRLEIVCSQNDSVHFKAYLEQNSTPILLEEKSRFEKIGSDWVYFNGEIL